MAFNFVKFERCRGRQGIWKPAVTIIAGGRHVYINEAAYREMGKPTQIILGYDEEQRAIGFSPITGDTRPEGVYRVKTEKDRESGTLSIQGLLTAYGLGAPVGRYPLERDGDWWYFRLPKGEAGE